MIESSALDQDLLKAVLQSIPHGIVLFTPEGQILFANSFAEQLLGFRSGGWRNNEISCLFLEDDCDIFLPNIIKLTLEKDGFEGEALLQTRQNQEFFAYLTTSLYRSGERDIILCTIQDIDTLKTLQHESAEADRVRSMANVVDQMAHHIRNPIAAIGGFAARLLRKGLDEKERNLYQEIIYQEAIRLDTLLRNLASFTTLPRPALVEENLESLLVRALDIIAEPFKQAAPKWRAPSDEQLRSLCAYMDLQLLAQCLANIITNSLESGDTAVALSMQVHPREDCIQLSVTDNGCGIEPDNLPLVFDPLFTTKNEHVGLGLTISQRIINDHAGSIDIESEAGRGTKVTLEIPRDKRRPIRVRPL
jgi:PAS domain S-box-containing protein